MLYNNLQLHRLKTITVDELAHVHNGAGEVLGYPMAEALLTLFGAFVQDGVPPEMLSPMLKDGDVCSDGTGTADGSNES